MSILKESIKKYRQGPGENQNPTLVTLKKVAKAFGVSVDDLIK